MLPADEPLLPAGELRFSVACYDEKHEALLKSAPCYPAIQEAIKTGIKIKSEEFLAYSMFRHHKNKAGWSTYNELRDRLPGYLPPFLDYFDLTTGTVRSAFVESDDRDTSMTETAGIGAALAVVSKLNGLTEADWEKIPVSQDKDLDFTASTGREAVEVEAKGTVADGIKKSPGISSFRADIEKKKVVQRGTAKNPNRLIGVIASFPAESREDAHCWLLDPPIIPPLPDPVQHKLVSRLQFYWIEFSIIASSRFLTALVNRLQDLAIATDYQLLDAVPLMHGDGANITQPGTLMETRSVVGDNLAVGEVIPYVDDKWFYYGMDAAVLPILLSSEHDPLLRFESALPDTLPARSFITARIRSQDLINRGIEAPLGSRKIGNRREIKMAGKLYATSAGRVFGIVEMA